MKGDPYKCIYCSVSVQPKPSTGDHVLPSALTGSYLGDKLFKSICARCNNLIGHSEEQLVRCGPESLLRGCIRQPFSRSAKRGKSTKGAKGAPAPRRFIQHPDFKEFVQPTGASGNDLESPNQLVFVDEKGGETHFRLNPDIGADALRRWCKSKGIVRPRMIRILCDEIDFDRVTECVLKLWPGSKSERGPDTEPGNRSVLVAIECTWSRQYYQAIAKIALHYYLLHNRRGYTGHEGRFSRIKSFIMTGNGFDHVFPERPRKVQFSAAGPDYWDHAHVLAVDDQTSETTALIHLFIGERIQTRGHYVQVASASQIVLPRCGFGHVYRYGVSPVKNLAGMVELLELRWPGPIRSPAYAGQARWV